MVVPKVAGIAAGGPIALRSGDAARLRGRLGTNRRQIPAPTGQHVDLIAGLAPGNRLLVDETPALKGSQRAVGGERMAVEHRIDDRALGGHPEDTKQVEETVLAFLTRESQLRGAILTTTPMSAFGHGKLPITRPMNELHRRQRRTGGTDRPAGRSRTRIGPLGIGTSTDDRVVNGTLRLTRSRLHDRRVRNRRRSRRLLLRRPVGRPLGGSLEVPHNTKI